MRAKVGASDGDSVFGGDSVALTCVSEIFGLIVVSVAGNTGKAFEELEHAESIVEMNKTHSSKCVVFLLPRLMILAFSLGVPIQRSSTVR